MPSRPRLIGIAGGSCAGKTELARQLAARLAGPPAPIVSLDAYYRDLTALAPERRARWNFDHPRALDWSLLVAHLERLATGEPIQTPVYDFCSHTRTAETRAILACDIVIIEGLLTLFRPDVRRLLDLTVFIETDERVRLERRLLRDVRERGRPQKSVLRQWHTTVSPMFERWVRPTRQFASVEVDGCAPLDENASRVLARFGAVAHVQEREVPSPPEAPAARATSLPRSASEWGWGPTSPEKGRKGPE